MTAQVNDHLHYDHQRWSLVGMSAGEPFDPRDHGFAPMPLHTACWRGFVCGYAVRDSRLFLDELEVNHRDGDPPALHGVAGTKGDRGPWKYAGVALPLAYAGSLVVARDFIQELYVHMGFHPAWKYRHACRLDFEGGTLVRATSLDAQHEKMRIEAAGSRDGPAGSTADAVRSWIAKTFDRTFRR